jgi:hypothetical protein
VNIDEVQLATWQLNRNRQVNFDTLLQVINLRSQPEDTSTVITEKINFKEFSKFGFLFEGEEDQTMFSFTFSINHKNVFDDGISNLGALYSDCDGVPMIKIGTEWDKLPNFLDTSPELSNIYFEVLEDE